MAVFPKLSSPSLEDFTIRVAESWRVGRSELDNGAILFLFVEDRAMRIEVGYGLEGALPDALARRILDEQVVPLFRQGDWARAEKIFTQHHAAADVIVQGDNEPLREQLCPRIVSGDLLLTVGISQLTTSRQGGEPAMKVSWDGETATFTGVMPWVTTTLKRMKLRKSEKSRAPAPTMRKIHATDERPAPVWAWVGAGG